MPDAALYWLLWIYLYNIFEIVIQIKRLFSNKQRSKLSFEEIIFCSSAFSFFFFRQKFKFRSQMYRQGGRILSRNNNVQWKQEMHNKKKKTVQIYQRNLRFLFMVNSLFNPVLLVVGFWWQILALYKHIKSFQNKAKITHKIRKQMKKR